MRVQEPDIDLKVQRQVEELKDKYIVWRGTGVALWRGYRHLKNALINANLQGSLLGACQHYLTRARF